MNKRMIALAHKAGMGSERWNTTTQFESFLEKFADLIYKDIITVVAAQALSNESALDVFKNLKRIYEGVEP